MMAVGLVAVWTAGFEGLDAALPVPVLALGALCVVEPACPHTTETANNRNNIVNRSLMNTP
jgi:hypothetical protein